MAQTFTLNSSVIGVDLNNAASTALFAVGTHCLGNNGTEFVYVQANTSISGLTAVAINTVSFTCAMASVSDLLAGSQIGFAQTSISSQAYGWVAIRGLGLTCIFTGSGTAPTAVGICLAGGSNRTGSLSIVSSASGTLAGVQITDATNSTSGAGGTVTLNVTWPRPASTISG